VEGLGAFIDLSQVSALRERVVFVSNFEAAGQRFSVLGFTLSRLGFGAEERERTTKNQDGKRENGKTQNAVRCFTSSF